MSAWSTSTEVVDGKVRVQLLLTADPEGGLREFRPYLDVDLDETHALILFGELGLALQALRPTASNDNAGRAPRGGKA